MPGEIFTPVQDESSSYLTGLLKKAGIALSYITTPTAIIEAYARYKEKIRLAVTGGSIITSAAVPIVRLVFPKLMSNARIGQVLLSVAAANTLVNTMDHLIAAGEKNEKERNAEATIEKDKQVERLSAQNTQLEKKVDSLEVKLSQQTKKNQTLVKENSGLHDLVEKDELPVLSRGSISRRNVFTPIPEENSPPASPRVINDIPPAQETRGLVKN